MHIRMHEVCAYMHDTVAGGECHPVGSDTRLSVLGEGEALTERPWHEAADIFSTNIFSAKICQWMVF